MKIRKILVAVISLFMTAALLTGCGTANSTSGASDLPVIKLGSDSYPPYNYLDEDGNPTGIDVELATEAFSRMGYRVEIVQIDWEKRRNSLRAARSTASWAAFLWRDGWTTTSGPVHI